MRDRLIELIKKSSQYICEQDNLVERIADKLIAEGVVVLPVKVGDTVYCDICNVSNSNFLDECVIKFIEFDTDWDEPLFTAVCREKATYQTYWASEFGKRFFKEPQFAEKKGKKK